MKNFTINKGNSKNTTFSVSELSGLIQHSSDISLRQKISNYVKKGYLEKVVRGIYSIPGTKINTFELANKIYSPSYISFFSALYHYGIIFQYSHEVYLAYKKSDIKNIEKLGLEIRLKNMKSDILLNTDGLIIKDTYTIASAERAFLDTIYLYGVIHFDNINKLQLKKIKQLIPIYKRDNMMINRVRQYFSNI